MPTFMPAPGWPAIPAGWLPEQSWNPPAAWPPAPPGWAFYRGAQGEPVAPPPGHWQPPAPLAAPQFNAPPVLSAPAPAPKRRGRWVAGLIAGGVALVLVGGAVILLLSKGGPELTVSQFNPYGSATTVGTAPNLGMRPTSTDWNLDPDSKFMQVPACRKQAEFHDAHMVSVFATSDSFHSVALMDTRANMDTWVGIIRACTTAGLATGLLSEDQVDGETDGVKWSYMPMRLSLYYGNVAANITVIDCAKEVPGAVKAFKQQVEALR